MIIGLNELLLRNWLFEGEIVIGWKVTLIVGIRVGEKVGISTLMLVLNTDIVNDVSTISPQIFNMIFAILIYHE